MKNTLGDLNNHLFAEIERLGDEELKGDELKQQLIWEKHYGPIPKGHVVIFADRDKRNFNLDNLVLVSQRQLLVMNRNNLIKNNSDVTKTGLVLADLMIKISDKKN